jgi:hypothetical protein
MIKRLPYHASEETLSLARKIAEERGYGPALRETKNLAEKRQ